MDDKKTPDEQFVLMVTTFNPVLARGTRRKEAYTYTTLDELKAAASWQIVLRADLFEHHYTLALKKAYKAKDYDKVLDIWRFLRKHSKIEPGLRLEWEEKRSL